MARSGTFPQVLHREEAASIISNKVRAVHAISLGACIAQAMRHMRCNTCFPAQEELEILPPEPQKQVSGKLHLGPRSSQSPTFWI